VLRLKKVVVGRKSARARARGVIEEQRPHAHVDECLRRGSEGRRLGAGNW